jgi:uncharacterized membrane protein YdcZ (DUF606 family)
MVCTHVLTQRTVALNQALGPKYILFPGLAGALVLVAVSVVTNQIKAAMTSKVKKA